VRAGQKGFEAHLDVCALYSLVAPYGATDAPEEINIGNMENQPSLLNGKSAKL
jgi:hypothetical protein